MSVRDVKIPKELQVLVDKGAISKDQALAVIGTFKESRDQKRSFFTAERFLRLLSILGAALIGIGVILFFAANWQEIPAFGKTVLLIGFMILAYAIGYFFKFYKQSYPIIGEAAFLIGSFLYGASIFFILQTYHIEVEYPNEVLFWMLGVIPLGYLLSLPSVAALGHMLFMFWFGYMLLDGQDVSLIELVALYIPMGVLFVVLGRIFAKIDFLKIHKVFLRGLGYLSLGVSILPFTSIKYGREIFYYSSRGESDDSVFWAFYVGLLILASILALVFFVKFLPKNIGSRVELLGAPLIAIIAAPFFMGVTEPTAGIGIFFNMLLLAFLLGVIFIGYWERKSTFVNLGVIFLGIDVLIRYVEFVGDLLQGAAFFIIGGLMLLGLAIALARLRREMIKRMENSLNAKIDAE